MKTYRLSSARVIAAFLFIALMAVLYLTSRAASVEDTSPLYPAVSDHAFIRPSPYTQAAIST